MKKTILKNKLVLRGETIRALVKPHLVRAKGGLDDTDCRGMASRPASGCPIVDVPVILP
jgi:hypothetical protein